LIEFGEITVGEEVGALAVVEEDLIIPQSIALGLEKVEELAHLSAPAT
jgi:hypothetical protein